MFLIFQEAGVRERTWDVQRPSNDQNECPTMRKTYKQLINVLYMTIGWAGACNTLQCLYCLSCMAITAQTNDSLMHISSLCVSVLVRSFTSLFCCHLLYQIKMVKYTLKQQILLYDTYMKTKLCKRRFCHKHPDVRVLASSTVSEFVNKLT